MQMNRLPSRTIRVIAQQRVNTINKAVPKPNDNSPIVPRDVGAAADSQSKNITVNRSKTFEEASESYLENAVLPRVMLHHKFRDTPPSRCSQHRNESMHLAIDLDFLKHLFSLRLQTTIMIMQYDSRQSTHHRIEES